MGYSRVWGGLVHLFEINIRFFSFMSVFLCILIFVLLLSMASKSSFCCRTNKLILFHVIHGNAAMKSLTEKLCVTQKLVEHNLRHVNQFLE